ncbi:Cof-type HAD-IIB family hydrolase [Youxingia wuxianensis]|uniref:Cof-type HAD-IIB family hydrolase n=1 Tax=Youxingia wuxianensis TaxID=2763678 RepID=A0A926EP69_9FIRM|nr:Cof-type HAD-IIB family hydrolase [Youxingia wuxianensis]MBC8584152.1 Cof-type HAD-IIB family hydrolase [Youxingia wuxianensis]
MGRKLLALDLDGTTLSDDSRMSPYTLDMLEKAKAAGCVICFVTGRKDVEIGAVIDQCYVADYLILNNGGKTIRLPERSILAHKIIEQELARKVINFALENQVLLYVCCPNYTGINFTSENTREYEEIVGYSLSRYQSVQDVPIKEIEGFVANVNHDRIIDFIDRENLPLRYVQAEESTFDIVSLGVSKWGAVKELSQILGISVKDIVSAGNYMNDIDLIRGAGLGVAVKNALEEVKQAADYVTERTNDEGAVGELIEKFVLNI